MPSIFKAINRFLSSACNYYSSYLSCTFLLIIFLLGILSLYFPIILHNLNSELTLFTIFFQKLQINSIAPLPSNRRTGLSESFVVTKPPKYGR